MAVFKKTHVVIFSIFLLFATAVATQAADATFRWTPNTEEVSGYRIHYGTSHRNYSFVTEVGLPAPVDGSMVATVKELQEGTTYYFAATAYRGDEQSDYSEEVVYTVPVTPPPTPKPPTVADISLSGKEDTILSGQLSTTSSEPTTPTFTVVSQPSHGTLTVQDATGAFTYTPVVNYSGDDTFSYTATNSGGTSDSASVTLQISPVNDSPVAGYTEFSINENTVYSGTLTATDIDGQDNLGYSLATRASNGIATISPSGSFTYTPNHNFFGTDSFTFTVNDGHGGADTAQVRITVQHVNKAPVVQSIVFSVDQGTQYNGQLTATDENNDSLSFATVTTPTKGTVTLQETGSYIYTAPADASGADQFTFQATDGSAVSNTGTVDIIINEVQHPFAFELGELPATSEWQHVTFSNTYFSPAVIAKPTTMNIPAPGAVSIRNLTEEGFDIRIRELDNASDRERQELVSFMVMERGHHQIADNVFAAAQCTSVSGLNTFQQINFPNAFTSQPVIVSSIVTENEPDTATLRVRDITLGGFSMSMQEQANINASHAPETVCYIAMEKWSGVVDGLMVEAGSTEKILIDKLSTISFQQQFPTVPFVLTDMQSANGMNTAVVGMTNLSVAKAELTIVEDQAAGSAINHPAEIGGYFAVTPYDPQEDSDQDGLTNEQEAAIHTHPGLWDTDQDAINDGNEYDHWLSLGINPDADSDQDGIPNIQDTDSDNDGFPDGVEIFKDFNPINQLSVPSFTFEIGELSVGTTPVWIQFNNQYVQPVIIADTTHSNTTAPDTIQISDITANGCNIQLQANNSLDNSHKVSKLSYIVTEDYVEPEDESSEPADEVQEPSEPTEPPQVTEPTEKPTDEPNMTSGRFYFKTLSSLISLFNEMMNNMNSNRPRRW